MPQFGGTSEKCSVCSKTVYLAEKIVVEDKEDKKTFHKTCLKCTHCKATLSLGNYASMNGVMYCKPHFKQLFATKGNYNEGFGKEKLTSKWAPSAPAATPGGNSFVPVEKTEDAKPAEKKDTPTSVASRFQRTTTDKCEKCAKTVYATEKIVIEEKEGKKVFHKACLRCTHCAVVLTLGSYASMGGVTYCKPHLKQLFATKGNYDEGFGKEKHTTKWEPTANTSPTTFVPVEKTSESVKEPKTAAPSDVANKFKNISGSNACDKCGKTVYLTEKVVVEDKDDKKLYHKSCLRCTHCQVVLSLGNYASMGGVTYCKPHFKQLFASKGNYDEGFGKEKHTAKWIEQHDDEEEPSPKREEARHEEPRHEEPRHEEPHREEPRHEVHHEEPRHEERHEEHHEEPRHEERHDHSHHDHDHDDSHDHHDYEHEHDHDHEHEHEHEHERHEEADD
jgi:uncharacterized CHY-type Zn-finger protein